MKSTIISLSALCLVACACNNAGTDSTEKKDSSTTTDSINSRMSDSGTGTNTATNTATPTDEASSSFLVKAANGGMSEVQEAQLAQQKGTNQAVKDFAAMLIRDHTAGNNKVKALAAPRNVNLPASVEGEEQKMMDDLSKKSGRAFDKAYIDGMVKDHQKDIKEFETAASKVGDTEVKSFIINTLPTLRIHLDSAKAIQKRVK